MQVEKSKEHLLKDSGYRYNFNRMIYFNTKQKKIFSLQYVEDNPIHVLKNNISEVSNDWKFYFNMPVSEKVKDQILSELSDAR